LIEHDDEDLRNLPFLDRKATLARLLRETEAGIVLNEHIAEDGATVFAYAHRVKEGRWRLPVRWARSRHSLESAISLLSGTDLPAAFLSAGTARSRFLSRTAIQAMSFGMPATHLRLLRDLYSVIAPKHR
jgi:hypothetical protein